jgi:anthranilate synthase/aminodeoxychorismate synthase-like glutamine amidotransferase
MILIIDNYDSFAYNLAQYLGEMKAYIEVHRNDAITLDDIEKLSPSHIFISPGPCTPKEAGISNEVISHFKGRIPILGVCLGHQCIGYTYGASVVHAENPMHGKQSAILHDGKTIFSGLDNPFMGGRYHSLIVADDTVPNSLEISARTTDGTVMGLRDRDSMLEGIQFHPESILTSCGHSILSNFLNCYRRE